MKDRGLYLLYTFYIWAAYVLMFWIPFYSWGNLSEMPLDGMLSAFIMNCRIHYCAGRIRIVPNNGRYCNNVLHESRFYRKQ